MNADDPSFSISLAGCFDCHVHAAPDSRPRWHTAIELAERAERAAMAGFVLKNHEQSTVALAREVSASFPNLFVVGGLVLNRVCGGLDEEACRAALADGARFIWLPTKDGRGERQSQHASDGLRMLDRRGRVLPEVRRILARVAEADAVLATGHISAGEVLPVITEARRANVRRLIVNHPEIPFLRFPVELQRRLRDEGAMLERCYPRPEAVNGFDQLADEIRDVGVSSTIVATDLGRLDLPSPWAGLRMMIQALQRRGFGDADIDQMTGTAPLRLARL